MLSKKLQNIVIELAQGDITDIKADALVNAANTELWMGAGVAGAIKRKGGAEIEQEAMLKGPVNTGEAVHTGAGALNAKFIIHAAVMGPDLITDDNMILEATLNSLALADALECETVAFPALGTGVGGFSIKDCARIMLGAIKSYDPKVNKLKKVIMVLFAKRALDEFEEVWRRL
jgi:O-acetyl-ADP-ribose deacetylase